MENLPRVIEVLLRFHQEVDRFFDEAVRGFGFPSLAAWNDHNGNAVGETGTNFVPQVSIARDEKEYIVSLEVAGIDENDINIELQDRSLKISGKKEEEKTNSGKEFYRVERRYGSFQRILALPDDAEVSDISASLDKGVLKINVPRNADKPQDAGRKIEIQPGR